MAAHIRLATGKDAAALADIYRPAVDESAISFELESPNTEEMARRVESLNQRLPWLVCDVRSDVVGYAYASPHRDRPAYQWSVEVSAYVRDDARRAGVARALYTSLFAVLSLQGFQNAYAGITLPNAASVGLHMAVGFAPLGVYHAVGYKHGAWHDVEWLERPLALRELEPPPPTPLPLLADTPELCDAIATGIPLLRAPFAS